jgi:hypothetical protein
VTDYRDFHIGSILTVTDAEVRLVSPDGAAGVHCLLDWMTGDVLMTHQLPRALLECQPSLRQQHPDLARVAAPEGLDSEAAVLAWLAEQVAIYGETRPVVPLAPADHTYIDPLTELRMMRPDAEVIVVEVPGVTE